MGDKWERVGEVEVLTCRRTIFSRHVDREVSLVRGLSRGQSNLRVMVLEKTERSRTNSRDQ